MSCYEMTQYNIDLHDDSNQANKNERTANAAKKNFVVADQRRTLRYLRTLRVTQLTAQLSQLS